MPYVRLSDFGQPRFDSPYGQPAGRFVGLGQYPAMTTYEFARMKALESNGLDHESAKARIYAERGASGEPKVAAAPGDAPVVTPTAVAAQAAVATAASSAIPWATIAKVGLAGGALGLGAFVASRLFRSPGGELGHTPDLGDAPTGVFQRNARRNSRRRNGRMQRGVIYAPGETGWVEDLLNGTWRIANVPLAPINVDDVVTLKDVGDGNLAVDKVVRRVFGKKTGVYYPKPHKKNYMTLAKAFEKKGWKLEGGVEGMALLAHDGRESPVDIASKAGVEITTETMRLR